MGLLSWWNNGFLTEMFMWEEATNMDIWPIQATIVWILYTEFAFPGILKPWWLLPVFFLHRWEQNTCFPLRLSASCNKWVLNGWMIYTILYIIHKLIDGHVQWLVPVVTLWWIWFAKWNWYFLSTEECRRSEYCPQCFWDRNSSAGCQGDFLPWQRFVGVSERCEHVRFRQCGMMIQGQLILYDV